MKNLGFIVLPGGEHIDVHLDGVQVLIGKTPYERVYDILKEHPEAEGHFTNRIFQAVWDKAKKEIADGA